ncbi:MAG: hypothetical protein AB7L13_16735 [Acidimicrobiia bacterium]
MNSQLFWYTARSCGVVGWVLVSAAVAAGVVSMYLLAAVEITSLMKAKLSKRTWHLVHLASFPLFVLSTVHMLTAGTDAGAAPLRLAAAAVTTAVAGLITLRVMSAKEQRAAAEARAEKLAAIKAAATATVQSAVRQPELTGVG